VRGRLLAAGALARRGSSSRLSVGVQFAALRGARRAGEPGPPGRRSAARGAARAAPADHARQDLAQLRAGKPILDGYGWEEPRRRRGPHPIGRAMELVAREAAK